MDIWVGMNGYEYWIQYRYELWTNYIVSCSRSTPLGLGVNLRLVQALFSNQIKVLKKLFYDYKRMNYVGRALGSDIQWLGSGGQSTYSDWAPEDSRHTVTECTVLLSTVHTVYVISYVWFKHNYKSIQSYILYKYNLDMVILIIDISTHTSIS